MTDLMGGVRLLLPARRGTLLYGGGSLLFLAVVAMGLRAEGSQTTLWGLTLTRAFGVSAEERRDGGFVEMMQHAWTFGTLPWLCFGGMRRIVATFEPQFEQFLGFSRRSRLFVEAVRILASLAVFGTGLVPLLVGAIVGCEVGVGLGPLGHGFASCAASSAVVVATLYAAVVLRIPPRASVALSLTAPWFLTATGEFLRHNQLIALAERLPLGLPYTVSRWNAPQVKLSAVLVASCVVVRLAACARTRRAGKILHCGNPK